MFLIILNLSALLCVFFLKNVFNLNVLIFFKVLSHNLCTVLCIPHDPVALEEHFRDDDDGPVSSQGYMPYLNKYILDKVIKTQRCANIYFFSNCNAV